MKSKNKKILPAKKTAIIAVIVVIGLLSPSFTYAQTEDIFKGGTFGLAWKAGSVFSKWFGDMFGDMAKASAISIGHAILVAITDAIHWLFHWLVRAGAAFLNGMIRIGFDSHLDIVKVGWEVTRDFSNMFFILFLVIVAFATILRFEQYGIRQLLPKVIIIALLINFSYVIGAVVVDFSNITASFFIKDLVKYTGEGWLVGEFVDSLNLLKTNITIQDCEEFSDEPIYPPDQAGPPGPSLRDQCKRAIANITEKDKFEAVTVFFISSVVGSIVLLIAAFTFFAGGILLLIRIVVVWFLLIIVPFAFLSYIMPGLRRIWQMWWSTFLRWCFFAPAYAFFLWLALKISIEGRVKDIANKSSSAFDVTAGPFSTIWTATPGNALIHYFFIIALLLGGLIAASKMGIYGANVAMKIGQKWGRGATRWTGARLRERAALPLEGVAKGAAKIFGRVPGLRKLARAPALVMKQQQKEIAEEKKRMSQWSPDTIKSLWHTFNRTQRIAGAQFLSDKADFKAGGSLKEKDMQKIAKVANIYGEEQVKPLLTNRLDLAPLVKKFGETDQEAIEKRLKKITPENAGNIQYEAITNPQFGNFIMDKMTEHFRPAHYSKIANVNVRVMNEITNQRFTNPAYGRTPGDRKTHFEQINKPLADYIEGVFGQSLGWHF